MDKNESKIYYDRILIEYQKIQRQEAQKEFLQQQKDAIQAAANKRMTSAFIKEVLKNTRR